jgi:hypothetical protein
LNKPVAVIGAIIPAILGIILIILYIVGFFYIADISRIFQLLGISRFVIGIPYFGLTLCIISYIIAKNKKLLLDSQISFLVEVLIFVISFDVSMLFVNGYGDFHLNLFRIIFFVALIAGSNFIKVKKEITIGFLIAGFVSLVSAYLAYPFYNSASGESFYMIVPFQALLPSFYLTILVMTFVSFFFSYCLMSFFDNITILRGKRRIDVPAFKSIIVYFQIIPIALSPLALLTIINETQFLEDATLFLYFLCFTQIISMLSCAIFWILGNRISSIKYLGITSFYSLLSFIGITLVIFNFVVQNIDSGAFGFVLILCTLFSSALGITFSRFSFKSPLVRKR